MARANKRSATDDIDLLIATREAVMARESHDSARLEPPLFCSSAEVQEVVKGLKLKKASGPDDFSNRLLKSLPPLAIDLLTRLFNGCYSLNYFPASWKLAKIIAIPKAGKDSQLPSNNRPISLLSNPGKVFEKLILNRLEAHVSENNLFIKQQFGFRQGHSTVQQILRITERAALNFNRNRSTGLVLLDLEKCFDAVWHDGLIHKLMANSYPSQITKLIKSFLSSRKAFVTVQGCASETFDVPAGVPQGSLLSPHLFNLFINDIPTDDKSDIAIYADDTALFVDVQLRNAKRMAKLLSEATKKVFHFFLDWKISPNKSKTECIAFSKSPVLHKKLKDFPLVIDGEAHQWSDQVTYLGMTLDKKLNFGQHIQKSIQKAGGMLKTLFPLMKRNNALSVYNKLSLYRAMIRPILTYASPIFSNCAKTHFERLQKMQNKALKMATNSEWLYTRTSTLHESTGIPMMRDFVSKLNDSFYSRCNSHDNALISNLGQYDASNLGFRLKHRLPKLI